VHAGKVLPANHPVVKARPDGGPYVGLLGRLGPRPGIVLDSDHVAIALVDSLIDRLIQLVEWRKHRRTALLTNLVEPTFAMFEEVHANYLKRFRGYREEIQSPDADIRRLIDTIATDALFAAGDRAKLLESANVIDDETVGAFVESVVQYLGWPRGNVAPETFGVSKGYRVRHQHLGGRGPAPNVTAV
jgi:hypothetical protein